MMTQRIVQTRQYRTLQEALDRIEELEIELGMPAQKLPILGLTPREFAVVCLVGKNGYAAIDRINALVFRDENLKSGNLTRVFMSKARKKLAPYGIQIKSIFGSGYAMDAESLATWRKAIAGEAV